MSVCRCGRENDARRSFCGGCGSRVARGCTRCQFLNAVDDAFCGGCGDAIDAAAVVRPASDKPTSPILRPAPVLTAVPSPVPAAVPASADTMSAAELASLLGKGAAPAPAQLPAIVSQDDLDRLFGGP